MDGSNVFEYVWAHFFVICKRRPFSIEVSKVVSQFYFLSNDINVEPSINKINAELQITQVIETYSKGNIDLNNAQIK